MDTPTSRPSRTRRTIGAIAIAAVTSVVAVTGVTTSVSRADAASVAAVAPATAPAPATQVASDTSHDAAIDAWLDLWNGDYAQADDVVSPDVRVHAAMLDGSDSSAIRGPEGMVAWIDQMRTAVPDLHFSIQVGPIVDGDQVALRWTAEGTYAGGMPGATAPAGTPVSFTGTDLLDLQDGQVVEYGLNADALSLVTQLQVQAG